MQEALRGSAAQGDVCATLIGRLKRQLILLRAGK